MCFNHIKTALLLGAMSGLLLILGYLGGERTGLIIALIVAVILNFFICCATKKCKNKLGERG